MDHWILDLGIQTFLITGLLMGYTRGDLGICYFNLHVDIWSYKS